ncbi:unnamed protein product [Eruca vesicaria subsp. sativa]|uniref:ATP synthase F0 subunit 8 n=1 Tax=Eruca vesicaria subsp. sativa TaxID=29727 RepID=A0ABC8LV55_ERUVS|nr:unnamed protein product [Eruca vesicaria subsp. sativa]
MDSTLKAIFIFLLFSQYMKRELVRTIRRFNIQIYQITKTHKVLLESLNTAKKLKRDVTAIHNGVTSSEKKKKINLYITQNPKEKRDTNQTSIPQIKFYRFF